METKPVEVKIQDLVYNIDIGIGLRIVQFVLASLVLGFLILWFTAVRFRGLKEADAMDLAQLGRNLLREKSFVTQCVRPGSMQFLARHSPARNPQVDRHPDIRHPPVYPLLLAGAFAPAGKAFAADPVRRGGVYTPEQWCIVPLNHLFVILSGVFVYLLARRLFSVRIARLTLIVFFLSRLVWEDSLSGLGLPVVWFFGLGAWYFALRAADALANRAPAARWLGLVVVSAVMAGLATLTRYAALTMLPGLVLFLLLSLRGKSKAPVALYLVIVAAVLSPWIVRNKKVSGAFWGDAPRTALHNSKLSEADGIDRTMKTELTFSAVKDATLAKLARRAADLYRFDLGRLGEGLLLPLFFTTFLFRFSRRETHVFRWSVGLSLLTLFLAACLFDSAFRLFHMYWPIMAAYGLAFFFVLLDRLQWQIRLARMAAIAAAMALSALPFVAGLLPPAEAIPYPPYLPTFVSFVSGMLEPKETMCTDMPWATAWYGNRNSIYVPVTLEEFYEINDYHKGIRGLYFTTLTRDLPFARVLLTGPYKNWFPILQGRLPSDFPLMYGLPLNNMDQLFLSDRVRWGAR